jgi:hypothetical protein
MGPGTGNFVPQNKTTMKTNTIYTIGSWTVLGISALGIFSVSAMAIMDPQGVMDLVQVKLENNDAYSSIRGVYGGVGFTLLALFGWLVRRDRRAALGFVGLFWGMYAISRLITIASEGELGAFGSQWLVIESTLAVTALLLFAAGRSKEPVARPALAR